MIRFGPHTRSSYERVYESDEKVVFVNNSGNVPIAPLCPCVQGRDDGPPPPYQEFPNVIPKAPPAPNVIPKAPPAPPVRPVPAQRSDPLQVLHNARQSLLISIRSQGGSIPVAPPVPRSGGNLKPVAPPMPNQQSNVGNSRMSLLNEIKSGRNLQLARVPPAPSYHQLLHMPNNNRAFMAEIESRGHLRRREEEAKSVRLKNRGIAIWAQEPQSHEQNPFDGPDEKACMVCCEYERTVAFIPCGHVVTCMQCGPKLHLKPCPVCRTNVTSVLRIYS